MMLALLVALVVLTGLVVHGNLARVDQFAFDHALQLNNGDTPSGFRTIFFPFYHDQSGLSMALDAWIFLASVLLSGLVLAVCCGTLFVRGRREAALLWGTAWIVGNAVELLGKTVINGSVLKVHGSALGGVAETFPSGHAIRAVLMVAALGFVWPRAALPGALWVMTVLVVLIVSGSHVPSDVVGGLLVGLLLALLVRRRAAHASGSPSITRAERLGALPRSPEAQPARGKTLPLRVVRVPGVDEKKVIAALEDEVSLIKSNLDAGPEVGAHTSLRHHARGWGHRTLRIGPRVGPHSTGGQDPGCPQDRRSDPDRG